MPVLIFYSTQQAGTSVISPREAHRCGIAPVPRDVVAVWEGQNKNISELFYKKWKQSAIFIDLLYEGFVLLTKSLRLHS